MADSQRLDLALVARQLLPTRAQAQAAIAAGQVTINGVTARKASATVQAGDEVSATPAHPWVSRAGVKLDHALETFRVSPTGWQCLDVGASTGGFTDVLLARGAGHVTAIDVGTGQFAPNLATHARVALHEHLDVRQITPEHLPTGLQLIVVDLSFISQQKAISALLDMAPIGCTYVGLFKPQFELQPADIGKNGLVRDAEKGLAARDAFVVWLNEKGWPVRGTTTSPILGGDGNQEYLIHAMKA